MTDALTAEGIAPAIEPQPQAPAAPATAQVPASPAPVNWSIPPDRLADTGYGTNWHQALADAKSGREARDNGLLEIAQRLSTEGYTPREYLAFLDNYEPGQVQAAPEAPATPEAPPQPGLTKEQARDEFRAVLKEDREQRSQTDLRQAEADHRATFLDDAKLTVGEDGKGKHRRKGAESIYDQCVADALADSVPSWASDEDRAKAARGLASPAVLTEADRRFKETWSDMGNEAVAAAVTEQETVPDETLSGGPGGSEPPLAWDDMSEAQRKAGVLKGVDGPLD